jgi:hypothetical protein
VDHSFSSPKRDLVTEARTDGISDPVILVLDVECPQARAIYRAIHGSPMPAEQIGPRTLGAIEKLSRPQAIDHLRRHGSRAGEFLAAMLQRPIPSEYSTVVLVDEMSMVDTFTRARRLQTFVTGYEDIRVRLHRSEPRASAGHSTLYLLEFDDGEDVPLCCETGGKFETAALTILAATRKRWVEREGRMVEIEAFDKDLATELQRYKDRPGVVAEALRALRKLGYDKDRWLVSVLWGRRSLRTLARRIEHELTGR